MTKKHQRRISVAVRRNNLSADLRTVELDLRHFDDAKGVEKQL